MTREIEKYNIQIGGKAEYNYETDNHISFTVIASWSMMRIYDAHTYKQLPKIAFQQSAFYIAKATIINQYIVLLTC